MSLALYLIVSIALIALWSRFFQRVAPAIALVLILLPMLFTGRALFTGRVYAPVDLAFAYEPLASQKPGIVPHDIALSDLYCQIIPWQKAVRYALSQRQWPLWNPFILCGDILAAAAQPAVYDPFQWIALVLPLPHAITFGASLTFLLAAFFTYAFARACGRGEIASLIAAAIYMCSGMITFFVGWPLGRAWALLPLVLFGVHRLVHERKWGVLLAALVLEIVAGHPESILHVVAFGVAYGVFEICVTRKHVVRVIASAIAAGIVALALTAIYLLPFAEAGTQTVEHEVRSKLYAHTSYDKLANRDTQLHRLGRTFLPYFDGLPWRGGSTVPRWDPLSARAGSIAFVLAIGALFVAPRRAETWFYFVAAVISIFLTCGMWPFAHALHALPLFNIAINERFAYVAVFAVGMLASTAIDRAHPRVALAVLALILMQRVAVDGGIYPSLPASMFYPPIHANIPKGDRIAGVGLTLIANTSAMYELEDVRGYEAMTFKRLHETYPMWSTPLAAWFNMIEDPSKPFVSFLGVRHIFDGARVIENPHALPRAFVPPRIRYERDGAAVLEAMKNTTDFSQVAWIEAPETPPQDAGNGPGSVMFKRDGLDLDLDADMQGAGWVVISQTAWKGWRAYVDGHRVQPHFANHAFLGVHVPAGHHRVHLVYLPESFTRGRNITLATLIALAIYAALRKRFQQPRAV